MCNLIICKNRIKENPMWYNLKKKLSKSSHYPNQNIEWIKNCLNFDFSYLIWMSRTWPLFETSTLQIYSTVRCYKTSNIHEPIVKDAVQSPWGATRNGNRFEKFLSLLLSDKSCLARSLIQSNILNVTYEFHVACHCFFLDLLCLEGTPTNFSLPFKP